MTSKRKPYTIKWDPFDLICVKAITINILKGSDFSSSLVSTRLAISKLIWRVRDDS